MRERPRKRAVDQARAAYESQIQNVSYNRSQLDLAERNLVNTELRAPFDGTVAARFVESSEVAARGQHILEVLCRRGDAHICQCTRANYRQGAARA